MIAISFLVGLGLALPFIGCILASIQIGEIPVYFTVDLSFILLMEAWNLIPIVLCISCYNWCIVLKKHRYIPICAVYLLIIYCHYEAMFGWADAFAWLVIIIAPLFSLPVFVVALVFSVCLFRIFGRP